MSTPRETTAVNPLLEDRSDIPFDHVRAEHVAPAVDAVLAEVRAVHQRIGGAQSPQSPAEARDVLDALDRVSERAKRVTSVVSALNAVRQTEALRSAWTEVLPRLTSTQASFDADPRVFGALTRIAERASEALDGERARYLEVVLDRRRRAGAGLSDSARERVVAIKTELAELSNTFQNNVLDGTNAEHVDVDEEGRLRGVPEAAVDRARQAAKEAGVAGWRFTLHQPSLLAVMDHAEDRALRRAMYEAQDRIGRYEGRDNTPLVPRILRLRRELAGLLGYRDWADFVLADRMAADGARAQAFERELYERVRPVADAELRELTDFGRERFGIDRLEPWDVRFLRERLRRERLDLDDEALRPWFSLQGVQDAAFALARELFGLSVRETTATGAWHPDVRVYEVEDREGRLVGRFYADWHPRSDKRGGAWKASLRHGGPGPDGFEPHVAMIAGNLAPPQDDRGALLSSNEARTVFHEFGHLLHHIASTVTMRSLAGTQVAWDFVELPSQILENWLYQETALQRFARHVDDGRPLPDGTAERLRAAQTFGAGWHMLRQIGLGTVDLAMHVDYDPDAGQDPVAYAHDVLRPFMVHDGVDGGGMLLRFTHVFAGGYAAGYYSYLWSEMLDADAFRRFEEEGLFDATVGEAFRATILSRGNAAPPEELIRAFLGRDPEPEAMLRRNLGEGAAAGRAAD